MVVDAFAVDRQHDYFDFGIILNGVGLLVASPVVICISLAAYRQLFGTDDQTGFLNS